MVQFIHVNGGYKYEKLKVNDYVLNGKYAIYKLGSMSVNNLRIIDNGKKYGCMNTGKNFYPEGLSLEERKALFLEHRRLASASYNEEFDPKKIYVPKQNKEGKAVELTRAMVEAYEDGWDLDIPGDILIITKDLPGVVAGFPVADCPVLIASDLKNGVTATAHCGAEMIDNYLPKLTIESLQSKYDSKLDDIYVYIGAHAGNNWTYDSMPKWAKESFWEETGAIKEKENGEFEIDLRKALLYQLNPDDFETFIVNNDDTITNPNYYSNSASRNDKSKAGRQFIGAYYKKR